MTPPPTGPLPTPERLDELWRFAGYGPLPPHQPLVPAGDRLIGVTGGTLFAIDIFHGKEPAPNVRSPEQGFPYTFKSSFGDDPYVCAAGGVVYFMDGSELTALRLSDGQPLEIRDKNGQLVPWEPPTLEQVSGLFVAGETIIAVHIGDLGESEVTAFTAVNGARAFGPVVISDVSPGSVSYGEGAVFFIADERLHAVNVDFGDRRFEATGGGVATESLNKDVAPCVASNVVLAAGKSLHFFDTKTGVKCFTPIAPSAARAVWFTPVLADKGKLFIASNTNEVIAIRTSNGSIAWRTPLTDVGAPSLVRGQVMVTTEGRRMLATLSVATGNVERRMALPTIGGGMTPVVTNETVFIPDVNGAIEARPFARQHAAYFDGKSSCIDIQPDGNQFDFGTEDFTIEAWIRSSEGGEIVSSHTTERDSAEHGFRLNLGENGELRVAVINERAKRMHAGRTRPTRANDGEWHHVALIRRDRTLLALLDGKSLEVFFKKEGEPGLSIGGKSALTIGASRAAHGQPAENHFQGLIRELRIWDRALDVATVQNNRHVQLTGNEPRLKGLWRLAEKQKAGSPTAPVNAVVRHGVRATFHNAASVTTDLALDNAGFPYLLHEVQSHWPYAGTWAARGEQPVDTPAALTGSVIAFGTNNALYGVRRADGRRLWQIDMPNAASDPVADGGRFFVLTSDDGLIAVNPMTGEYARVDAFGGFLKPTNTQLAAPAITATHIAAGAPDGKVRIVDRLADPPSIRNVNVSAPVRQLLLGAKHLFALCGADGALKIHSIDLASGAIASVATSNSPMATDKEWLFYVKDGKLARAAAGNPASSIQATATMAGTITGLAVRRDNDLIVVGTDRGEVHGLAMSDLGHRWSVSLPVGRARETHALYAPTFDAAGRLCCTTTSGTIAVLDPATGARVGLYIASQGAVTPALFSSATAYYGCADALGVDAYRDGALHSVVFGDTMVLRLGLDERGAPSREEPYALVDITDVEADKHTLHLMTPHRSCVEAWINVPSSRVNSKRRPGGGVLSICPTKTGGFDANLEVDETGRLYYSSRTLQRGKWSTLRVEANTALGDGGWHHVAVSRNGERAVTVYVDGIPVPDPQVTIGADAPERTVTGLKAFIGAAASAELQPVRPFCGMIADVRIWDTFLEPAEIAARMHVKLRGNEPDLLAFWNFDRQNANDAGPDEHHGVLKNVGKQPLWWLSDLAFEKPSYPYVTTAASVFASTAGQPKTYKVTITAHCADGSGLAGHRMDMWYVRNRDDLPLDVMFGVDSVLGVKTAEQPEPGAVPTDGKRRVVSMTTGGDGTISFFITPTRIDHTPAIDLRAGFMARHERLHVNVLLDEQKLTPPTPPSLVVQSKLIQDYSYSSGGKIDEGRDRSTWRTVIRATNPDGTLRAGEPVTLWGEEQTTVQVEGKTYAINKENGAELVSDSQGEIVIVTSADALNAPNLMARAAFMHRNDRLVIAPDQDLHRTLADVRGSDFTAKRSTRWKPGMKEGEGEALLTGDYAPHADKVAGAVTKVMAAAKPAPAVPPEAPRGQAYVLRTKARAKVRRRLLSSDQLVYDADPMRQPQRPEGSDGVVTYRTMTHAPRDLAVDVGATKAALDNKAGFVFETVNGAKGKPGVRFEMLDTRVQVERERGTATPPKIVLRGFFDIWDDIVDVAKDIYEGATKIVISVANAVEVAIHKMVNGIVNIVHVVVDSIVEAVNAVAGFFEQIGVMIMKVIEFLRALFDWGAILEAKNIISDFFIASIDSAKRAMQPARLEAMLLPLAGMSVTKLPAGGKSVNAEGETAKDTPRKGLDESRGVQGQMVTQKSRENPVTVTGNSGEPPQPQDKGSPFEAFLTSIPPAIPGLLDLPLSEMAEKLFNIVKQGAEAGVRMMIKTLSEISGKLAEGIDWIMKVLRTEIRIPFLSELYKWITGSALTLLDLICLALAVPVHIAHIAVTTALGNTRTFAADNTGLGARIRAADKETPAPRAVAVPKGTHKLLHAPKLTAMDIRSEALFFVLRAVNLGAGLVSDALFTKTVSGGGIASANPADASSRAMAKIIKGATGLCATVLQTFVGTPAFESRLKQALAPDVWSKLEPEEWIKWSTFGLLMCGDTITLVGGVMALRTPPTPQVLGDLGGLDGGSIDKTEYWVSLAAIGGFGYLLYKRTAIYMAAMNVLDAAQAHESIKKQVLMYYIRDMSMITARTPWCMFTQEGANRVRKLFGSSATWLYTAITGVRALAGGVAIGAHIAGTYGYGQQTS